MKSHNEACLASNWKFPSLLCTAIYERLRQAVYREYRHVRAVLLATARVMERRSGERGDTESQQSMDTAPWGPFPAAWALVPKAEEDAWL